MKPSPIQQPRPSPALTFNQLQPVGITSKRREYKSPFQFYIAQVFQNWEHPPIRVTREDTAVVNEGQEAVARLLRRVDRNIRELIVYANDRMIPGPASELMATMFAWYEDESINELQRAFDDLGKDNQSVGCICVWLSSILTLIDKE
ncbi:hypothetical protein O181_087361 [Austropuccinia psidii MF-1]|uniref:Uncharacterized protein n=1 Tax=Austropuccinia psidii MF-1 TaxID=1389203 RepID=A0A9Q3IPI1_9BASI|nr:hypothetical protein [Austropuccinia psidii MF-1]